MREIAGVGDYVDLRAEMDVLIILTNCQHPLDPVPTYRPQDVELALFQSPAPGPDDYCRNLRSENQRCLLRTERLYAGRGTPL